MTRSSVLAASRPESKESRLFLLFLQISRSERFRISLLNFEPVLFISTPPLISSSPPSTSPLLLLKVPLHDSPGQNFAIIANTTPTRLICTLPLNIIFTWLNPVTPPTISLYNSYYYIVGAQRSICDPSFRRQPQIQVPLPPLSPVTGH